jgi:site-specific DNA-cytosine methylase
VDCSKQITHISLCSGYAGIDLGLKQVISSLRTVTYVEIEAFAIENLVAKIEQDLLDLAPIFTDIKQFPWKSFTNRVDILTGGFPCQPFSNVGVKKGDQDPRHLWPFIKKGIEELSYPPIVFFENVEGIFSRKLAGNTWTDPSGTPVLLHILRELERMGYNATAGLFSAQEVGSTHQRKRTYILGLRPYITSNSIQIEEPPQLLYPNFKELHQFAYEPFRVVVDNSNSSGLSRDTNESADTQSEGWQDKVGYTTTSNTPSSQLLRSSESQVGGDVDGPSYRLGDAECYKYFDNRRDEMHLLGNGVVPQTVGLAFKTLFNTLTKRNNI